MTALPHDAPVNSGLGSSAVQGMLRFTQAQKPRFELAQGFDLHVQFGEVDPERLKTRQFDTKLKLVKDADVNVSVSTYTRLVGVELTGVSRMVDDSGRPVLESYMFVAADVL